MKRHHFSCYYVPSVVHRRVLTVGNRLTSALITLVETSPGVRSFDLDTPSFAFAVDGKEKHASVALLAHGTNSRRTFWSIRKANGNAEPSPHEVVTAGYASELGCEHRLFGLDDIRQNEVEHKNRQAAQTILYQGLECDTQALETTLLLKSERISTVGELARLTASCPYQTLLACLRMHVKGRVKLGFADRAPGERTTVERLSP